MANKIYLIAVTISVVSIGINFSACIGGNGHIEGAPCPCPTGYVCCFPGVCAPNERACLDETEQTGTERSSDTIQETETQSDGSDGSTDTIDMTASDTATDTGADTYSGGLLDDDTDGDEVAPVDTAPPDPRWFQFPRYCTKDGWCGGPKSFIAVSGSDSSDVWVAASDRALYENTEMYNYLTHWDGSKWSDLKWYQSGIDIGYSSDYQVRSSLWNDVWTTANSEIWGVGDGIFHFNGEIWSTFADYSDDMFYSVWGSDANHVWIGGIGQLLYYDGETISNVWIETQNPIVAIWGLDKENVFIADSEGTFFHPDGTVSFLPQPNPTGIWASDPNDIWVVSQSGQIFRWNGEAWMTYDIKDNVALNDIWGSSDDSIWIVGSSGTIAHWDGVSWTLIDTKQSENFFSVWGGKADDVWFVGSRGASCHWKDGSLLCADVASPFVGMRKLYGSSGSDIWAVGNVGRIAHWNGSEWGLINSGTDKDLYAVWSAGKDDAWVIGDSGTILHWDGAVWAAQTIVENDALLDVWGSGKDDVWVVSINGPLRHYDGVDWRTYEQADVTGPLVSIWGTSANNVWTVSQSGTVYHFDGVRWSYQYEIEELKTHDIVDADICGTSDGIVWVISSYLSCTAGWRGSGSSCSTRPSSMFYIDGFWVPLGWLIISKGWGAETGTVWAIGYGGIDYWKEGSSWSRSLDASNDRFSLVDIWGSSESDIWVLANNFVLRRTKDYL